MAQDRTKRSGRRRGGRGCASGHLVFPEVMRLMKSYPAATYCATGWVKSAGRRSLGPIGLIGLIGPSDRPAASSLAPFGQGRIHRQCAPLRRQRRNVLVLEMMADAQRQPGERGRNQIAAARESAERGPDPIDESSGREQAARETFIIGRPVAAPEARSRSSITRERRDYKWLQPQRPAWQAGCF